MRTVPRVALIGLAGLALSACSALRSNSAMELIQHQQEQQAMMRSAEEAAERKNLPSQSEMLLNRVREARRDERYFAVVAYARQYIRQYGHAPELDALYAEGLMETGQEAQSQALYASLVNTKFAAQAYHGLGLLAARAHRNAEAVKELSRAVSLQPANAVYLSDLGYAQLLLGDLDGAGLSLGQAAELAPDDARTLSNMAVLLLLRNQSANADALMHKAGFQDDARQRIYALAAKLRQEPSAAAPVAPSASVPAPETAARAASVMSSGEPLVSSVSPVTVDPPAAAQRRDALVSSVAPVASSASATVSALSPVSDDASSPSPLLHQRLVQ
ncbi:hypothetical protein CDEF62S_00963 [Castellaniella defragrans]